MNGAITALYRHPIKGFTPQRVASASLARNAPFPADRVFAVEDGPSGFDPAAPRHLSKQRFTVVAKIAEVAKVRTEYDPDTGSLTAEAPGAARLEGSLTTDEGRRAFAQWLTGVLGDKASGPLRVLQADGHRFMDHPQGQVSIINLASVRDLEARIGRSVNPLRFRANIYVDGWPPWSELDWADRELNLGGARVKGFAPTVRCAATQVDPATGERDIDIPADLHRLYGHLLCGLYVHVVEEGVVAQGERAGLAYL
jgi:uncharacterized protein YcbX